MEEEAVCLGTFWGNTLVPFPEVLFSVRIGLGVWQDSGLRTRPEVRFMCLSLRS